MTVALAAVMRDPFALADALLLATRTWQPKQHKRPHGLPGVSAFLESRLASTYQCVIMGFGHARRPTGRRQAIALRFPDSQDLPVSFPLTMQITMQITMHVASSGSVPSDRGGRREITYQRSGDQWATFSHQGWVECLTGSKSRHQVTKSQGAAKHSSQA